VRSYSWQTPIAGGIYTVYAQAYGNGTSVPLSYDLDGLQKGTIVANESAGALLPVINFEMGGGSHHLLLWTNEDSKSPGLGNIFVGDGDWKVNGDITTVSAGTLLTAENYTDFELSVDLKPVQFGAQNWHGPNVYFAWSNDTYVRLILHDTGFLEVAEMSPDGYRPNLAFAQTDSTAGSWSNLKILKYGSNLAIYFDGKHVMTYSDPLLAQSGQIGLGSDTSVTQYENLSISRSVIGGVWLLPAHSIGVAPVRVLDEGPDYVRLVVNSSSDFASVLYLGENYDPRSEERRVGKEC
jgi:hypothetical protein